MKRLIDSSVINHQDEIVIIVKILYTLLEINNNKIFNCYGINFVSLKTGIPVNVIFKYNNQNFSKESRIFNILTGDRINFYIGNGITYIGLESERIKYIKLNNKN